MKFVPVLFVSYLLVCMSCSEHATTTTAARTIGAGEMPNMAVDSKGSLHIVYGNNDSILYVSSEDRGNTFSSPALIATLPKLVASHMRGPQIACTNKGITVTACNGSGDIFSYLKDTEGKWRTAARVNDIDTVAREGLMGLNGEDQNLFAVWLDLRKGHNQIEGARSGDGGKSWSKNILVYASPDTTVCECCKPSVMIKGNHVYVMFRNWLNGNRDMYLIESPDGGLHFGPAIKLGKESWKLNGCPMDGGGLAIDNNNEVHTVWRRESQIFSNEPGGMEKMIGNGKSCVIASINNQQVYAWTENGEVMCLLPNGNSISLGKGSLPVIQAINDKRVICAWENDKHIYSAILDL